MESYLADEANHQMYFDGVGTLSGHASHSLTVGTLKLFGYDGYNLLNKTHGHVPSIQCSRTTKAQTRQQIDACWENIPGFAELVTSACSTMGLECQSDSIRMCIKHAHFLLLDYTSQVDFCWHEDTHDLSIKDDRRDGLISVIVQLSSTFTTAFQIMGCAMHEYAGSGAGVIFLGRCMHRSVSRKEVPRDMAVWKVAVFLDGVQMQRFCAR